MLGNQQTMWENAPGEAGPPTGRHITRMPGAPLPAPRASTRRRLKRPGPAQNGPKPRLAAPVPAPAPPSHDSLTGGDDPDLEYIGQTFSGYRIDGKLGEGGMGSVFLALQLKLQRKVAIKILAPLLSKDKSLIERFVREARSLARIDHHAIVPVYDMFDADGMFCIAMGFAGGGTVKDLLRKKRKLSERTVANILLESAQGLWAAFQEGIVHRDIKPDNLLLTDRNKVKIADFGLVKATEDNDNLTRTGAMMGTPAYMSPEQWKDSRRTDHRSDLYSLGCAGFELLTGKPPFVGPATVNFMKQHVMEKPPHVKTIRRSLSNSLANIVMRLLEKDPDKRFQTGLELAEALAPLAKSGKNSADAASSNVPGSKTEWSPPPAHDGKTRLAPTIHSNGSEALQSDGGGDWGSGPLSKAASAPARPPSRRRRRRGDGGGFFLLVVIIGLSIGGYFYREELMDFIQPAPWKTARKIAEKNNQEWIEMRARLTKLNISPPDEAIQALEAWNEGEEHVRFEKYVEAQAAFELSASLFEEAQMMGFRKMQELENEP